MNEKSRKKASKFMSLVLRHDPAAAGIELDVNGWTDVEPLLSVMVNRGLLSTRAELDEVVATNDKRRFAFDETGARIRANQGHSVGVDLQLEPREPPDVLFHGTVDRFLDSIRAQGLVPGERQHVHLSADVDTATAVGGRRGRPVILEIDARSLFAQGHVFYLSENGVWLTADVPPEFVRFPD